MMTNVYIDILNTIDPFSSHDLLVGVDTDTTTKITDLQLFALTSLLILILGIGINRPVYILVAYPDGTPGNKRVDELPILFKLFPLCFLFIYDIGFSYSYAPNEIIAKFSLPFELIKLKWHSELLNVQITRSSIKEVNLADQIEVMEQEGIDVPNMHQQLEELSMSNSYQEGLLTKMGAVLKIYFPTYNFK